MQKCVIEGFSFQFSVGGFHFRMIEWNHNGLKSSQETLATQQALRLHSLNHAPVLQTQYLKGGLLCSHKRCVLSRGTALISTEPPGCQLNMRNSTVGLIFSE